MYLFLILAIPFLGIILLRFFPKVNYSLGIKINSEQIIIKPNEFDKLVENNGDIFGSYGIFEVRPDNTVFIRRRIDRIFSSTVRSNQVIKAYLFPDKILFETKIPILRIITLIIISSLCLFFIYITNKDGFVWYSLFLILFPIVTFVMTYFSEVEVSNKLILDFKDSFKID